MVIILALLVICLLALRFSGKGEVIGGRLGRCTYAHSENGLNYPWLSDIHGGLKKVQFMEPPESGVWRDYTDHIWDIHCKVISHDPADLVDAHDKAFINPETRFAKLKFTFNDGTEMEPTREFYERESAYFNHKWKR